MATISADWDLRSSASPRSLAVYVAPVPDGGGVPSPRRMAGSAASADAASGSGATNPFDAAVSGTSRRPPPRPGSWQDSSAEDGQALAGGGAAEVAAVSVVLGTERGALHRRTYGCGGGKSGGPFRGGRDAATARGRTGGSSGSEAAASSRAEQPMGLGGDGIGGGAAASSGGKSRDGVHPLHRPVDLTGAVPGAIVGLVQTFVPSGFVPDRTGRPGGSASAAPAAVPPVLLMLVDDNRSSASNAGKNPSAYASHLVTIAAQTGKFDKLDAAPGLGPYGASSTSSAAVLPPLPRASCASYHPACGYVCASGTSVVSLPSAHVLAVSYHVAGLVPEERQDGAPSSYGGRRGLMSSVPSYPQQHRHQQQHQLAVLRSALPRVVFDAHSILPSEGARYGADAMCLTCRGRVAVVAVGSSFYALSGRSVSDGYFLGQNLADQHGRGGQPTSLHHSDEGAGGWSDHGDATAGRRQRPTEVLRLSSSGRVHPAVVIEVPNRVAASFPSQAEVATSLLFMASGRECAAVEILHDPRFIASSSLGGMGYHEDGQEGSSTVQGPITVSPPRNGVVTLASPILAAVGIDGNRSADPRLVAILTSDGLVQTRSPACLGVPLTTIEVGNRPNDFFTLRALPQRRIVSASYSGEGRLLAMRPESSSDLADRFMTLSVDAFGAANFPRLELADALSASYGATSYAGTEPTAAAKALLKQYLEAVLGLADDFEGDGDVSRDGASDKDPHSSVATLLMGTALLCKVCSELSPPIPSLANRAARSCSNKVGAEVGAATNAAAVKVCYLIAEDLLGVAASEPTSGMTYIEPAIWLLRACGSHERAIKVIQRRMNDASARNMVSGGSSGTAGSAGYSARGSGAVWSQLRYESYVTSHLSELWVGGDDDMIDLVINSNMTMQLLERNPRLGLSIFTSNHPEDEKQWEGTTANDDPVTHPVIPRRVLDLLQAAKPAIPLDSSVDQSSTVDEEKEGYAPLPLSSGRALAISYLESLVGIAGNRPIPKDPKGEIAFDLLPADDSKEQRIIDFHDELAYLLLDGVISELGDADEEKKTKITELGSLYRGKLRRFLSWPNAKVRSEKMLKSLPPAFLRERALLLGRLGRHDDALRILYRDLRSLDMALEYCDARFEIWQTTLQRDRADNDQRDSTPSLSSSSESDLYIPLVKVALDSGNKSEGVDAAIRVLSLRRNVMDCGTALRLLPGDLQLSAISRPFLIPAVVEGESDVKRLKIVSALLRARYVRLKQELTEAQISSQASLFSVPGLKSLRFGDLVRSSKPFRARPAHATSASFPDVTIIQHFFPRHLVIQATVCNSAISSVTGEGRALGDVSFVVAESSDEALLPIARVPLKTLPPSSTGSVWCALTATPQRLDDVAVIACELRYTVLNVDATTGAPLNFGSATVGLGRTYVEELEDIEIRSVDFQ